MKPRYLFGIVLIAAMICYGSLILIGLYKLGLLW